MAKKRKEWRLVAESMNGALSNEARVWDYACYAGVLQVWSQGPGDERSTVTFYNTANFRSLSLEPVLDPS